MTAFAAVLAPDQALVTNDVVGRIGSALAAVTGAPSRAAGSGPCVLLQSPLHPLDPALPFTDSQSGVVVAGQVLLEDPSALRERLEVDGASSDLAIVAAAFNKWGIDAADHLTGEYAFSLWDPGQQVLVCARDGLGIRLLYIGAASKTLVASNVIAAVLAHSAIPRDLDDTRLVAFLAFGKAMTQTRTAFRAVHLVPEGHALSIRVPKGTRRLRRHWWMPAPPTARTADDREIEAGYRDVLAAAVGDRLGNGPVAVLLSGGMDSTTIAAAARQVGGGGPRHAFTTVYPRLSSIDELSYAAAVADRLALPLTVVNGERHGALDALRTGPSTPQPVDEPTLADWRSSLGTAAHHSTVALYGEDGDAVFLPPGGWDLLRSQSPGSIALAAARHLVSSGFRPYLGIRLRERLGWHAATQPTPPRWLTEEAVALFRYQQRDALFDQSATALPRHPTRSRTQDRLSQTIPPLALTIGAELTRQRLELRLPLLDTRVLRYVFSLPPIPWCQRKRLPRAAYRGILPDRVLTRPKTGVIGFYDALVRLWRERDGGTLPALSAVPAQWIDARAWREAWSNGTTSAVMSAWRVAQLEAWLTQAPVRPELLCTA